MLHKIGTLLDLSQKHLIKANRQRILEGIQFQNMEARFESIVMASEDTFRWCVEDSEIPKSHPNLAISFRDWLATGSGVFHIAGKPGAGKSTLMKFLAEHPETKSELQAWAGQSKTLVLASFYFWRAGRCDQKSLEGLVRSILHTLLIKLPHLIPDLFPEYWDPGSFSSLEFVIGATKKIHFNRVLPALDRVLKRNIDIEDYSFCFFIDGLDEFEDPNEKHSMLARRLCSWTELNPASLKICVSSRQELAFMNNFLEQQRLYLHLLTYKDMEITVLNYLKRHPNFLAMSGEEQGFLVNSIVDRGEGVFLWVKLVLDEIWEALDEKSHLDEIFELLNTFPDELEAFFSFILLSVRKRYRREGWAILAVLSATMTITSQNNTRLLNDSAVSLTHFTFIADYVKKKDFGILQDVGSDRQDAASRIQCRTTSFSRRLGNLCKGLVEAVCDSPTSPLGQLNFIHRSIVDYLHGDSLPTEFQAFQQMMDHESFLVQSYIALVRLGSPFIQKSPLEAPILSERIMAKELRSQLQKFLKWMANRAEGLTEKHYEQLGVLDTTILEIAHESTSIAVPDWNRFHLPGESRWTTDLLSTQHLIYYLLADACRIDFVGYVTWAFRNRPGIASHPETLSRLLGQAIGRFGPPKSHYHHQELCNNVLAFFIQQPWFTPTLVAVIADGHLAATYITPFGEPQRQGGRVLPLYFWLAFISNYTWWSRHHGQLSRSRWELLKLFLQHDNGSCDLNFCWAVKREGDLRSTLTITYFSGSPEIRKSSTTWLFDDNSPTPVPSILYFMDFPISRPTCPIDDETLLAGKSFRWLIEQTDCEDRDEVLALIDQNVRRTQPLRAAALDALLPPVIQILPGKFVLLSWAFIFSSLGMCDLQFHIY